MMFYVDTSVLLRHVLGEPGALKEFLEIDHVASSELIRVEAHRSVDRYRIRTKQREEDYVFRLELLHQYLANFELIPITSRILDHASQRLPLVLGTLDAIHLATCILYAEQNQRDISLCSHDESLKNAGRAMGLTVIG